MTTRKFKREHEDIEVAQDRTNAKQVEKSPPQYSGRSSEIEGTKTYRSLSLLQAASIVMCTIRMQFYFPGHGSSFITL